MTAEVIGLAIVVVIWVISSLIKGFKSLLSRTTPVPPQAPPPSQSPLQPQNSLQSQNPLQPQNPFQAQASSRSQFPGQMPPQAVRPGQLGPPMTSTQAWQQQALQQARTQPRQPEAGATAVPTETNRQDFVRQEQELFTSEPASLGVSLTSPPPSAAAPNALFGGTDDLVRAIILQEVLGPPLCRRKPPQSVHPS